MCNASSAKKKSAKPSIVGYPRRLSKSPATGGSLVYRPRGCHSGIQFDLAERALVAGNVLLQNRHQRLGLLRAQIDALKISDFHLSFALLLQSTENQKEIPNIHTHLDAVGIALTIVRSIHEPDVGLRWIVHKTFSLAAVEEKGNLDRE